MSPRVTRSSARLAADTSSTTSETPPVVPLPLSRPQPSRKRKAAQSEPAPTNDTPPSRRSKKAKASADIEQPTQPIASRTLRGKKAPATAMSSNEYDDGETPRHASSSRRRSPLGGTSTDTSPQNIDSGTSRRRSSRKKSGQGTEHHASGSSRATSNAILAAAPSSSSSNKRSKKGISKKDSDSSHKHQPPPPDDGTAYGTDEEEKNAESEEREEDGQESAIPPRQDRMEEDDPFSGFLGRGGGPSGLSNTLRALSGMMSGMTSRLRGILENLRARDDPSVQLIALTELSELLLVSNEDNLAGHFSPDQYVKELVALMQPNDFGEENPEMMLLACRCIANLMEALPQATASVVYGGAVPVLCQKLLEIHFIDLAEQALSTLEKISVEFPSSIVREGGLTACLTYLDFFATSTQRTAVTTAANCCRNIPEESFPVVRDVMPILLNVLGSNDQKVVEQGSLCVSRVVESFKYQESKLEELVSPDLLKAIIRLLLPGSTNLISSSIHTQFLRVLAITARASPRLSLELLRMNAVDTLYQILTGVSPPSGIDNVATRIDKNIIMQALIRTPRDQIFETLNVICELLPAVSRDNLMFLDDLNDAGYTGAGSASMATRSRTSPNDKRLELLKDAQTEVRRFAVVIFPTLMHAYTSTVNLSVRQKVLTAQLKMLSNFEVPIIEDALRGVAYASHLASIMSQQENPMLVTFALQAAELLLKRLESIYRPQFYREGVMAETAKLAQRELHPVPAAQSEAESYGTTAVPSTTKDATANAQAQADDSGEQADGQEDDEDEEEHHEIHEDDDGEDEDDSDGHSSIAERPSQGNAAVFDIQDIITGRARKFMEVYGQQDDSDLAREATRVVQDLKDLAESLDECYNSTSGSQGPALFARLAMYFSGDALEGITSYELLTSGIVDTMLEVFSANKIEQNADARLAFLEAFMDSKGRATSATGNTPFATTAFSVLVHKLQDLLSRTEHFEVITVHQNAFESNRSSAASMLAKQLRLKLTADEDSGIPRVYRNIMVSIHAIATFRALDDYLRPRISLAERPSKTHKPMSGEAAAAEPLTGGPETLLSARSALTSGLAQLADRSSALGTSQPPIAAAEEPSSRLRRSARGVSGRSATDADTPATPTAPRPTENDGALECADEAQLSDDDDEDGQEEALNATVDDLEDAMDQDEPDPSAVNLEVANTGKVTARKEDGTRVATPLQGSQGSQLSQDASAARLMASARLAAAREMLGTPSGFSRPMSYASALQAIPQDWHIEFSVDGQPLANDTTIYRAVHFNQANPEEVSSRQIWSTLHKITFKRVPGPPSSEPSSLTPLPDSSNASGEGLPPSLSQHPQTASILKLMSILHGMNNHLDDVLDDKQVSVKLSAEPATQFVNTKLTAKLNRQLEEPLIVASNCLPTWSEDLARLYPFLFPFETRHLFLQSTSFGYSRSMTRWQNAQPENDSRHGRRRDERPFLGRTQRQKVRISRTRILESALKVMELYGSSPSILEVEYFEEVGTGLGPTLEFYSTVSKEFSKKKIKLWRENESEGSGEFAFGKHGLFPAPMSEQQANNETGKRVLHLFKLLGKFIARSMLDSRIIDISLNPTFFRVGHGNTAVTPSLGAVASVDQDLANSLRDLMQAAKAKRSIDDNDHLSSADKAKAIKEIHIKGASVDELGLDFTLPGYPNIELQPNGASIDVTIQNVELYVKKVIDVTVESGVQRQVDAFRVGFSQVFPYSALRAFTPDELVMLFGQNKEDWSLESKSLFPDNVAHHSYVVALMDSIKADHGFNLDSPSVRNLLHTMSTYDQSEQRDFLQFATGSPKLPIGGTRSSGPFASCSADCYLLGFKSLTPMFTVVCKPSEPPLTSDDYLPSVMTCVNYLKMPDYSSEEILRAKLSVAIREGQGAFHLS